MFPAKKNVSHYKMARDVREHRASESRVSNNVTEEFVAG